MTPDVPVLARLGLREENSNRQDAKNAKEEEWTRSFDNRFTPFPFPLGVLGVLAVSFRRDRKARRAPLPGFFSKLILCQASKLYILQYTIHSARACERRIPRCRC